MKLRGVNKGEKKWNWKLRMKAFSKTQRRFSSMKKNATPA